MTEQIIKIKVDDISPFSLIQKVRIDEQKYSGFFQDLKESFETFGYDESNLIIVMQDGNEYVIVDGVVRVAVMKELGITEIHVRCIVP